MTCRLCNKDLTEPATLLGRDNVAAMHKNAHITEALDALVMTYHLFHPEHPEKLDSAFRELEKARNLTL